MHICAISSYPPQGSTHGKHVVGGATYFKTVLTSLERIEPHLRIEVLAEVFDTPRTYTEGKIRVQRVWKRNSMLSLIKTMHLAHKNDSQHILVSHEVYMFGSLLHLGFFAFLLFVLRVLGKKITVIVHQVPTRFDTFVRFPLLSPLVAWGASMYFHFLTFVANSLIVFEEQLKEALGGGNNVHVIPLAVEKRSVNTTKDEARTKLALPKDVPIVLFFGFLSPYKGIDLFIKNWSDSYDAQLVIAGGPNPNHTKNEEYMRFVREVENDAHSKGMITTGFIEEKDIGYYFSASDMVVFPYREFISSSAPLAFAFSYEKPVLLSRALLPYFCSSDFKDAATAHNLDGNDFVFDFDKDSVRERIEFILSHYSQCSAFSRSMKHARSWKSIATLYHQLLTQKA